MCMIVSMFVSLLHCALDILATRKRVNHGGKFELKIPAILYLKKPLNWLKNKITKIEENLNETAKHCPK